MQLTTVYKTLSGNSFLLSSRIFIAAAADLLPSPLKKSTFSGSPQHSRNRMRNYGVQYPNNKTNITCNFCGTVVKGGAYRLKQHLIGGLKDAKKCPNSPEHVKEELKAFMENKQSLKAQQQMQVRQEIGRWFYDAGISYNAVTYESFNVLIEAIREFGLEMIPSGTSQPSRRHLVDEEEMVLLHDDDDDRFWGF